MTGRLLTSVRPRRRKAIKVDNQFVGLGKRTIRRNSKQFRWGKAKTDKAKLKANNIQGSLGSFIRSDDLLRHQVYNGRRFRLGGKIST